MQPAPAYCVAASADPGRVITRRGAQGMPDDWIEADLDRFLRGAAGPILPLPPLALASILSSSCAECGATAPACVCLLVVLSRARFGRCLRRAIGPVTHFVKQVYTLCQSAGTVRPTAEAILSEDVGARASPGLQQRNVAMR